MFLRVNRKTEINFFLNRPSLSMSRCRSRYEADVAAPMVSRCRSRYDADLAAPMVSFISSSMG
jgi:hypothetical protein